MGSSQRDAPMGDAVAESFADPFDTTKTMDEVIKNTLFCYVSSSKIIAELARDHPELHDEIGGKIKANDMLLFDWTEGDLAESTKEILESVEAEEMLRNLEEGQREVLFKKLDDMWRIE